MALLVVDDEWQCLQGVRLMLNKRGIQSYGAFDGLQALQMLEQRPYQGMVLGLIMPRMTGLEVLQILKQAQVRMPIIGMTGNPEARDAALAAGLTVCLLKPFWPDDLTEACRLVGLSPYGP